MKKTKPDTSRSGSVVVCIRERLKRDSEESDCTTMADEIAKVAIDKARDGEFNFVNLIIQQVESQDLTREEASVQIETFYTTVKKHVTDQAILAKIATDLAHYKERTDGRIGRR